MNIDNENNLLNKKVVYDLTPFSHLDFPNYLSCIVWLVGCGLRCDYCYNEDIVLAKDGKMSFNDVLLFLDTRKELLDGVVISGGEATKHNLIPFCTEVKSLGFKIKLDTNGINFSHIKELLDLNLIDFIALDYKAPKYKFEQITHSIISKFDTFEQTIDYLIQSNFDYEVRTTIHRDLLDEDDINFIIDDLKKRGYSKKYYLQEFLDTTSNIGNIKSSYKVFNRELLSNSLEVVWR